MCQCSMAHTHARTSLSPVEYLRSCVDSVLDANAMVRSFSPSLCYKTAPSSYPEALVVKVDGNAGLKAESAEQFNTSALSLSKFA